jgi:hypothetical protein
VSEARANDVDLLGPARSCRRLPSSVWLVALAALMALVAVAVLAKVIA